MNILFSGLGLGQNVASANNKLFSSLPRFGSLKGDVNMWGPVDRWGQPLPPEAVEDDSNDKFERSRPNPVLLSHLEYNEKAIVGFLSEKLKPAIHQAKPQDVPEITGKQLVEFLMTSEALNIKNDNIDWRLVNYDSIGKPETAALNKILFPAGEKNTGSDKNSTKRPEFSLDTDPIDFLMSLSQSHEEEQASQVLLSRYARHLEDAENIGLVYRVIHPETQTSYYGIPRPVREYLEKHHQMTARSSLEQLGEMEDYITGLQTLMTQLASLDKNRASKNLDKELILEPAAKVLLAAMDAGHLKPADIHKGFPLQKTLVDNFENPFRPKDPEALTGTLNDALLELLDVSAGVDDDDRLITEDLFKTVKNLCDQAATAGLLSKAEYQDILDGVYEDCLP